MQASDIYTVPRSYVILRTTSLALNFLQGLGRAREQHGDRLMMQFPYKALWLFHPNDVEAVLLNHASQFKKSENYRILRPLLGDSVITTDGETWRRQRRAVAPKFYTQTVREFFPLVDEITQRKLLEASRAPSLRLQSFLCSWSLEVASKCFFDASFPIEADKVAKFFDRGARALFFKTIFRLQGPLAKLVPWTSDFDQSIELIDQWVRDLIQSRRSEKQSQNKTDILSRMLPETDDKELRDQCVSLLLAGHDTTALTLFWTLHLLFQHPTVMDRAREEAHRAMPAGNFSAENLDSLPFIEQVLLESMRLYPVVSTLSREPLENLNIGNLHVEKGQVIQMAPWVTHRHPEVWGRPNDFDPDRFSPERRSLIPEGAFFPFGLGPRSCVGQGFALAQMKTFLVRLLTSFAVENLAPQMPKARPFLTLRPAQDTEVRIKRTR